MWVRLRRLPGHSARPGWALRHPVSGAVLRLPDATAASAADCVFFSSGGIWNDEQTNQRPRTKSGKDNLERQCGRQGTFPIGPAVAGAVRENDTAGQTLVAAQIACWRTSARPVLLGADSRRNLPNLTPPEPLFTLFPLWCHIHAARGDLCGDL